MNTSASQKDAANETHSTLALRQLVIAGDLEEDLAIRVVESGVLKTIATSVAAKRARHLISSLTKRHARTVLEQNPLNLLRPVKRAARRIQGLYTGLNLSPDDAATLVSQVIEVVEMSDVDFRFRLSACRQMIPSHEERLRFLLGFPKFFLIPSGVLAERSGLRFENRPGNSIWLALTTDRDGRSITLEEFPIRVRGWKPRRPTPPSSPPAEDEEEEERVNEEPVRTGDTLPSPPIEDETSDEKRGSRISCRIPIPMPERHRFDARDLSDEARLYLFTLIAFLVNARLGIHIDLIHAFVMNRPWLVDPRKKMLRVLELFVEREIRLYAPVEHGARLVVLRHEGLLHLGHDVLAPILCTLIENRKLPLPDDLDHLALPGRIVRRRIADLYRLGVPERDPRFKGALYASSQHDFWHIVES